ncbi:hypothetical protein PHYBLDRAFT_170149 [Phycomyces blakesleeanus NRRL 1555(-)]|uniref:Uncharacterized protein n=1 Tax=Phycomyces blakesleeanus (strain ATCC 8743b / DSM 1359 / FGSC 10004 / NBRC 33097 / NRRL 1555) TaxID=763407 RepID=A0A167M0T3_PHYB8|nr:hypothetical protein PHYBLDRAFT_170149 [Phycomyces blakesleeanus NRRL 1555(-)]OAD71477.1 hypothetical protein PHYBLDRAFT_170149 [Phycomyces blakesleeanus NRRL 1555(-)]|eukprot:XP_018289517.1 hypothetical protein PHYBLDRAFT_170149 [Phycomyces blakesleeanus NRRL 1555(-)]
MSYKKSVFQLNTASTLYQNTVHKYSRLILDALQPIFDTASVVSEEKGRKVTVLGLWSVCGVSMVMHRNMIRMEMNQVNTIKCSHVFYSNLYTADCIDDNAVELLLPNVLESSCLTRDLSEPIVAEWGADNILHTLNHSHTLSSPNVGGISYDNLCWIFQHNCFVVFFFRV